MMPLTLGMLICAFGVMGLFLDRTRADIESTPGYTLVPAQSDQLNNLIASSTAFNNEVAQIQSIENTKTPLQNAIINKIQTLASARNIKISRMAYSGNNAPISLSGIAPTEN